MPVDRTHAFAGGRVYAEPSRAGRVTQPRAAAAWRSFRGGAVVGSNCRLGPNAWCANDGPRQAILLGNGVVCRGIIRREAFGDGRVVIEDDVYIGDDCIVSCADAVSIGRGTLVGHGVQIFDNNSHPTEPEARTADWDAIRSGAGRSKITTAPVEIGERAWLGFGSVILKGVNIGAGAIVAAASVVTSDVAPGAVVAGNPARPI